jgi:hypothetical protein
MVDLPWQSTDKRSLATSYGGSIVPRTVNRKVDLPWQSTNKRSLETGMFRHMAV